MAPITVKCIGHFKISPRQFWANLTNELWKMSSFSTWFLRFFDMKSFRKITPEPSLSTRLRALWTSLWPKTFPSSSPVSLFFSSLPCRPVQNTSMRPHNRLRRRRQFTLGRLWHWACWLNGRINLLLHAPSSLGLACLLSFLYWRCLVHR